jgi:hypothetical protein
MRLVVGVAVAVAACGRVGFDGAGADADLDGPTWGEHVEGAVDDVGLASISTTEPIGGIAGDVYLAVISVKPSVPIGPVGGLGLPWMQVHEQCGGRDTARLAMYWAHGVAAPANVTATLNGGVMFTGSAVIAVHRITGDVSLAAPVANTSRVNTVGGGTEALCSGGVDRDTYFWDTHDTTGPDSLLVSAVHTARYPHTPGAGFTELSDRQAGDLPGSAGLAVMARVVPVMTSDVTIDGSFTSAPDWAAIAVSIRR